MDKVPVFGTLPVGTYPFLALQRPGGKPFVVERVRFLAVMKGIMDREISWEIVREPEKRTRYEEIREPIPNSIFTRLAGVNVIDFDGPEREKLVIRHQNGYARGVIKFYNQLDAGSYGLQRRCEDWLRITKRMHGQCNCWDFRRAGTCKHVQTQKRKVAEKSMSPIQRRIAKLERKRDEIRLDTPEMPWKLEGPICAVCEQSRYWCERNWRHELHAYTPGNGQFKTHEREHWLRWERQRDLRQGVQQRVKAWRACRSMNSTGKLYKIVNQFLSPHGLSVMPWSKLRIGGKRKFDEDFDTYLKRLWESCGLASKPGGDGGEFRWGHDRYLPYLNRLHDRKRIEEEIRGLKGE